MRVAPLGGIAGPLLFSIVTIVAAALRPDYSHATNLVSELGAGGTPYAALMNYAGFVPAVLMIALFGIALAAALPRDQISIVASILVTLFGAGMAADGIIACDLGCPRTGGSLARVVHIRIARVALLCAILGSGLVGVCLRRLPAWRGLSRYSLLTGAAALCFMVALATSIDSGVLSGLWQRLLLVTVFAWCAVIGLRLASRTPSERAPSDIARQPPPRGRRA